MDQLIKWADEKSRKPLVLMGARQVGKSYLVSEFGEQHFKKMHAFNFEKDKRLHPLFLSVKEPGKIIRQLSQLYGSPIDETKDLIFFDEIQACPEAITSLKYFAEDLPHAFICAAGSLLGLSLGESSFPVGKVNFLKIFPLDFQEYMQAFEQKNLFDEYILNPNQGLHEIIWPYLIDYLITGGLPEIVKNFVQMNKENRNDRYEKVRELQEVLILGYLADMAKHCGKENAMFLERIWRNAAEQVGQEKASKYKFKNIFPGKRGYEDFMNPIDWLKKAGILYQTPLIDSVKIPLSIQKKENAFKLFVFDIGIMNALAGLSHQHLLDYNFSHKGFIAENFVLQEMMSTLFPNRPVYTYKSSQSEIEFIVEYNGVVLPIEVKAGFNLKAKSLSTFIQQHKPKNALRVSRKTLIYPDDLKRDIIIHDWPLFLISQAISKIALPIRR